MGTYVTPNRPPESLARKGKGRMPDDDFRSAVRDAIAQSVQYIDGELSPDRATAAKYYAGQPFGNEEEGRSQAILTEVRDAVDGMMPSLLRVALPTGEHAVEFVPQNAKTVQQAEQVTDYVRWVFEQDNGGFLRALEVLKDGCIKRLGGFKWGWDTSTETRAYKQEGLTRAQLELLAADDGVTFEDKSIVQQDPTPDATEPLYDAEFTYTTKGGRVRIWSLPPEEIIWNRRARDVETCLLIGHRTEKTRGQLLAMGVKEADLDAHAGAGEGADSQLSSNAEEIARREISQVGKALGNGMSNDPELGTANDKILYCEVYLTIDYDGDGVAELRRICTIGSQFYPVENNPAEDKPFAVFSPYPEPHALIGGSVADRTMDVQKINSALLRGMLDSLAASIFPRMAYLEGQASVADIMNNAIGAPMRERVAGAIRALEVPFVGKEAMPIMAFMQEVIERRTGKPMGTQGLDADALQSTGKEAVGAVLTGSQEQLEMMVRVFAEQTLKPLFLGVGRLLIQKQDRKRTVRLRGQWVDVDPRSWNMDLDVSVNVGLGTSFTEKKIATLMAAHADQKETLTMLGMDNPLVTLPQFRNTKAKIFALQGLKDVDSYYNPLPPDWKPPAPAAPPPDPEAQWVQAEKEMNHTKAMKELAIKADELAFEREKFQEEMAFKVRELAVNSAIEMAKINQTANAAKVESDAAREVEEAELTIQAHDQLHDQTLERDAHEHEKEMAVRAADTADTQATASAE